MVRSLWFTSALFAAIIGSIGVCDAITPVENVPNSVNPGGSPIDAPGPEFDPLHGERDDDVDIQSDGFKGSREGLSMVEQWESLMANFVPEALLTFQLNPNVHETFLMEVKKPGELVRGGFFISAKKNELELTVTDPEGDLVLEKKDKEGIFHFVAKRSGTYTFVLHNPSRFKTINAVTFSVGAGKATTLNADDLSPLEQTIKELDSMVRDVQGDSSFLWIRQRNHLKSMQSAQSMVWMYSVLQLLCIVLMSGAQVWYIRSLVIRRGYQSII